MIVIITSEIINVYDLRRYFLNFISCVPHEFVTALFSLRWNLDSTKLKGAKNIQVVENVVDLPSFVLPRYHCILTGMKYKLLLFIKNYSLL